MIYPYLPDINFDSEVNPNSKWKNVNLKHKQRYHRSHHTWCPASELINMFSEASWKSSWLLEFIASIPINSYFFRNLTHFPGLPPYSSRFFPPFFPIFIPCDTVSMILPAISAPTANIPAASLMGFIGAVARRSE